MAVSVQTLISRSTDNMGAVDSHIKAKAIELIKKAYDEGIFVEISQGLRTDAEQNALYAKGRTAPGNIVTHAKAGQSIHNYGLAIDYFLVSDDGTKALWSVNSDWRKVADMGKDLGFEWGGDWTGFKDYSHLQYTQGHDWRDLRDGWRPDFGGKPVDHHSKPSDKVKAYQRLLNDHGYHLKVDGIHGPKTDKAVRDFQKDHGLVVDGICGPKTLAALKPKHVKSKAKLGSAVVPYPGHLIKEGSSDHHNVERIQRALGIKVDGLFGGNTKKAVEAYQRRHGLSVDGKCGMKTWQMLF